MILQSAITDALKRYKEKENPESYTPIESEVTRIFNEMLTKVRRMKDTRALDPLVAAQYTTTNGKAIDWTEERMIDWMREMQEISAKFKPIIAHMTRHATENNYEQWFYPHVDSLKHCGKSPEEKIKTSPTASETSDESRSNSSFDSHTAGQNP